MKFERDLLWLAVSFVSLTFVACVTPQSSETTPIQMVITTDSMDEDISGQVSLEFAKYNDWKIERREVATTSLAGNKDLVVLSAKADCFATSTQDVNRVSFCDQVVRVVDPNSGQVLLEAQQRALGSVSRMPSWEPLVDKIHHKVSTWKGRVPASDSAEQQQQKMFKNIDRLERNNSAPAQRTNY